MPPCSRCGGTGHHLYHADYGTVCFRCWGSCVEPERALTRAVDSAWNQALSQARVLGKPFEKGRCALHGERITLNKRGHCPACVSQATYALTQPTPPPIPQLSLF